MRAVFDWLCWLEQALERWYSHSATGRADIHHWKTTWIGKPWRHWPMLSFLALACIVIVCLLIMAYLLAHVG